MEKICGKKYQQLSKDEMSAVNGGKKTWEYDRTEWTQIDCPESAQKLYPDAVCWDSTQYWNLVNKKGKVLDTAARDDSYKTV